MRTPGRLLALILLLALGAGDVLASEPLSRRERKDRIAALEEKYRNFLDEVDPILSRAELDVFLKMESDPQRDRFIEEFWRRRDPDPDTAMNEYRDGYYARREVAKERYLGVNSDRGRIYLLRGEPAQILEIDQCRFLRPIEIWTYPRDVGPEHLVFFRPYGDFMLWQGIRQSARPSAYGDFHAALEELLNPTGESIGVEAVFFEHFDSRSRRILSPEVLKCTNGQAVIDAVLYVRAYKDTIQEVFVPPQIDEEGVRRMLQTSVIVDPDAPAFEAGSSVTFGGVRGSRRLVRLVAEVPRAALEPLELEGRRFYQLNVVGETMLEGRMFERWEYRFDFPEDQSGEVLPVVAERALREGEWELRMKIVDPQSGSEAIITRQVNVPGPEVNVEGADEPAASRVVEETRSVIRLVPPDGAILTGFQKFSVITAGEGVAGVEFYLDGTKIMRKMQPPFELELDMGPVPRPHDIRALALDRRRRPIDEDILRVNDGTDPFRVRIVSPRLGQDVTGAVRVELEPQVPSDQSLAALELYVNDDLAATLYGEPWIHTMFLPKQPNLTVVRVVARLEDPSIRPVEDVVILNGPENLERVDVRLIEVPATVVAGGRPAQNLALGAFEVLDENRPVEIVKFERMSNLPLSIGIAIDGSASMKDRLSGARQAASSFLSSVLTPRDQAFLLSFDRRVFTLADWTSDTTAITEGLASLRAEESTALYDAVVESLYRFVGREGQRALVLISDGADTASQYGWTPTLEYARRLGVPIYSVGLGISAVNVEARSRLETLAEATGGRAFFVADVSELAAPYEEIERELRSQYLLGFYMPDDVEPGSDWRQITVRVNGADQVRALPGYYP